ncbi:hypothetical protein [Pseudodesulfovibrio piezophilus]|uniref:Uncharacterized protein n=1 Tax=Pseudodesulfovibrio piezophilus (strain DSM 21447 / JCM 15486 / C1TLV30) TaxID=1322246 RepID=M1WVB0_PSEP2|nr:hypothetical protein [Pseudodesulfovibrio piezophilus]CCH48293.1 conserved protein of unknown function [Pseudodesulfovibrio piezophilus C1TLV30]
MSYLKEFRAAASRTRKLGLDDIAMHETPMALDPSLLNALEATGHIPFAQRAKNAFNVNFGMFHMVAKKFHIPGAIMTLGNVKVHGEKRFQATSTSFKEIIREQSGEENMGHYHLWTTLPGGYILDHAILPGLQADGIITVDDMLPAERYLYDHADELPHGLTYHPMIVGLEFFVASGTIDREALEYLMGEQFPKQYQ